MPGPFASEELFPVVVKYAEVKVPKSGLMSIVVIRTDEMAQRYKDAVREINTQWVTPNWTENNDLLRSSTRWDREAGERVLDWTTYRAMVLEKFMRTWDIKDDKGVGVPCTKEYINKLDPNIGAALAEGFLAKISVSERDLGN